MQFWDFENLEIDSEELIEQVNNYCLFGEEFKIEQEREINKTFSNYIKKIDLMNKTYSIEFPKINIGYNFKDKCKRLIKKIIRKAINWCITDILQQQNRFNAYVTQGQNELKHLVEYFIYERIKVNAEIDNNWYKRFEDTFRGSEDEIRKRNEEYLKYFLGKKSVVDLGCGRGEFLQLLSDNSIIAEGVDSNTNMIKECLEKKLAVKKKDVLEYLKEKDDESLDGIFASQLIEHLQLGQLVQLIQLSYEKLEDDGVLILETVNPLSLGVFCYGFYIDPTHDKPVHPAMLRFLLEYYGFHVEPIQFINPFPTEYRIETKNISDLEIKEAFNKLNDQIYGAQDYYIVCRKRG